MTIFGSCIISKIGYCSRNIESYEWHTPKTINFIPPSEVIELWKKYYQVMQEFMIYGETLEFDKLTERLEELKMRLRNL